MKISQFIAVLALSTGIAGTAAAQQTYSIGSNPQGSLFFGIGAAMSKVMVEKTGLQFRVAPFGGSSTYIPMVARGELALGLANGGEMQFAYTGDETFEGKKYPDLRVVTVLFYSGGAFAVPTDSPIKTIADLKGKRMPTRFTSGTIFRYLQNGLLATEGLGEDDLRGFPVPTFVAGVEALIQGKVDAAYVPVNAAVGQKAMASMKNGWRYVGATRRDNTEEKMSSVLPSAIPHTLQPAPNMVGVKEPAVAIWVPFVVFAGTKTPDDVVYRLVKVMHENKPELVQAFAGFRAFEPKDMARPLPTPYHDGAIKFYKETGEWPPKKEK